ncbi:MAG: acetyl-CoA C-acetyltransferase [Bacteroidetes bacterium]|nr:acetyl-CoA C-acetyltransferase [Bacteroidota bacterium]
MGKVYIVDAGRTGIGSYGGSLKGVPAHELGTHVLKSLLNRTGLEGTAVDEVILGNVLSAGQGMGPARQTAIHAGIPAEVPAWGVNMLCGSGMKACMAGTGSILLGTAGIVAAGGMENMSRAPFILPPGSRFGLGLGDSKLIDHMIEDGLTDVFNHYHMGITAENIAEKHQITREEQDEFALISQNKAAGAAEAGRFDEEIIPLDIVIRKTTNTFCSDEFIRPGSTIEGLRRLRPAFKKDGTVTAGNASGINDGAAILLLAGEEAVKSYNLKPLAEIVATAQAGVDPAFMGLGPVPAVKRVLDACKMQLEDMELLELNEAFAAQSLGVIRELSAAHGIPEQKLVERMNVNGGAIALGHPIGASGSRIMVTLLYELRKRKLQYGLASLCIGGGMGTAVVIKVL